MARNHQLITVLDVGSSKVAAMIVQAQEDGAIHVLGAGQRESHGVARGFIANIDKAEKSIREAIEQAERMAGRNIESTVVAFSGSALASDVEHVAMKMAGHQVTQQDIDSLLRVGRSNIEAKDGYMVMHAQPALYTLDGLTGVRDPLGLHADRLGVDIHAVMGQGGPLRNLDLCVRQAHLSVDAIVAGPLASGLAVLSEEERERGIALVEIGGGVTNIALFAGGMLVGVDAIDVGSSDITEDIAASFGVRASQAERAKCLFGSATPSPSDSRQMIELVTPGETQSLGGPKISRSQLVVVIRQRMEAIAAEIARALKEMGYGGPVSRQVVLTGGGAELSGIADFMQGALGRNVRVGTPKGLHGLPDAHSGPAFASLAGLAIHAVHEPEDLRTMVAMDQSVSSFAPSGAWARLFAMIRGQL